jgi:HEAT repeat protein
MTVFIVIAVLLVGLAVALLLRFWAMLRQQARRSRQESLASVAALLRAPDKSTRLHALNVLASFPLMELSAAEAPLWDLMRDPDSEVRSAAGRLIAILHPPERLLQQLAGRETGEKLAAIEGLAAIGGQRAFAALLETAARAPEESVRQAAKSTLAGAEGTEAFPFLMTSLNHEDPILRSVAKDALRACGFRALAPLLSALRDPRKTVRSTAAELISDLRLQEGAEALVSLLSDPVDEVRAQAARSLARLSERGPGTMAALRKSLSDSSTLVQEEAACALASLGDSTAVVPLLDFLRHRAASPAEWRVRPSPIIQFITHHLPAEPEMLSAWKSLLDSADERFLSMLAKAMEAASESVRKDWIERLPSTGTEAREVLCSLLVGLGRHGLREPFRAEAHDLAPEKGPARAQVARLMGEIGAAEFGEEVYALLSDPDATVRRQAAWSAGRIAHFATVDGLCQALSDPDAEVRAEAARSLTHLIGQMEGAAALPQEVARRLVDQVGTGLLQAVNDPVNNVRQEVAKALGISRMTAAIPSLVAWALGDENPEVSDAAGEALSHMPPADAVSLLAEALSYKDTDVRRRAAEILGAIGSPGAVSHLIRSLQDDSPQVRESAASSLWQIGSAGHSDALVVHLQSPDAKIRASIAGLLGKVKAEGALDGLAHVLRDPNEFVRAAVVNALAAFGPLARRHLSALIERLKDPDAFVRARAAMAVSAAGGGEAQATEALLEVVKDDDSMVVAEALNAFLNLALKGDVKPLARAISEPRVRAMASEMLRNLEPGRLRLLLDATRDAGSEAQIALLGLLAEMMKSCGSVAEYKQDLSSVDTGTRLAAIEALSLFGTEEAAMAAAEVLKNDPVAQVRRRAALILGKLPGENAQRALSQAAERDLDPEVREAARSQIRLHP